MVAMIAGGFVYKPKPKWKLHRGGEFLPPITGWDEVEAVPLIEPGDLFVAGQELLDRAIRCKAWLGLRHADFLLSQGRMPIQHRQSVLLFPETQWVTEDGQLAIFACYWMGMTVPIWLSVREEWPSRIHEREICALKPIWE